MLEKGVLKFMNTNDYKGVCVFIEQVDGVVGQISYELLGKARELAFVRSLPIGSNSI